MIKRFLVGVATTLTLVLAGCAVGIMTKPITEEIKTSASAYENTFTAAYKAITAIGTIKTSDRQAGAITGLTPSGASLTIQLEHTGSLTVTTYLPPSMLLYNTTLEKEHEAVVSAIKAQLSKK